MPDLIIIAGPNGAGKTTFANRFLNDRPDLRFVNADEIERSLPERDHSSTERNIRAGRVMLEMIDALTESRASFVIETTLASLTYAVKIPEWRAAGYSVQLIYLRLPNADASVARVAKRVALGGHDIPERDIRRRFTRSLDYLESRYKPIVDEWYIWESLEDEAPRLIAAWDRS
jgi:predicted ABC-type ATPase